MELPGFRFHPTDEELLVFYLRQAGHGKDSFNIIGSLDIYRHEPWDLPGMAKIGEREWYFFVPRDRKRIYGGRPNRTTERGFWKATGSDRSVYGVGRKDVIGLKKTLVFYRGRAPRGLKTDWVMNEYRLPTATTSVPHDDMVLCKVYRKATSIRVLEQRARNTGEFSAPQTPELEMDSKYLGLEDVKKVEELSAYSSSAKKRFPELKLEVPAAMTSFQRIIQDPIFTQLRSPWSPYSNLLSFCDQNLSFVYDDTFCPTDQDHQVWLGPAQ